MTTAMISSFALLICASIAILYVENSPEANIKTPEDAVWWAITTITTVGYGDRFPVSIEGRFIATILMIAGLGMFSTLTGYISLFFVDDEMTEQNIEEDEQNKEIIARLDRIESILKRIDKE